MMRRKSTAKLIQENTKSRETLGLPPKDVEEEMAIQLAIEYGVEDWKTMIPAAQIIWKRQRKNKKLF